MGQPTGPVTLLLLHEETGHPLLPRVKLVTESTPGVQVFTSVGDVVLMVLRGWDIGPTIPMGPSPRPSWNAQSHGHLQKTKKVQYPL